MSLLEKFPHAAIDLVLTAILPLILPACGGDRAVAEALILRMLCEYRPETVCELRAAGEAIGFSLETLQAFAEAGAPDLPPAKRDAARKAACTLNRSGLQTQRRLDLLQRKRQSDDDNAAIAAWNNASISAARAADPGWDAVAAPVVPPARTDATNPATSAHAAAGLARTSQPAEHALSVPSPAAADRPAASHPSATDSGDATTPAAADRPEALDPAAAALAQAEATLAFAETRLIALQSRYKGAPPPHSQAAQQIQAQQRTVNAARMALAQARRQQADAPKRAA